MDVHYLLAIVAALLSQTGCGDDTTSNGPGTATSSSLSSSSGNGSATQTSLTSSATETDQTSGGRPNYPEGCEEQTSPFLSRACAKALETWCRPLTNQDECESEPWLAFEEGEFVFGCGWARVYTVSDVATCEIASVSSRCEAGIFQTVGCEDECDRPPGSTPGLYTINALPNDGELVKMACAPDGAGLLDGPVGEWTSISYQEENGPGSVVTSCASAGTPGPPEICGCLDAACEAK